ncbi:MAG: hypothetical protein WBD26_15755, partial [Candidatus Acidiferrales bacterium]
MKRSITMNSMAEVYLSGSGLQVDQVPELDIFPLTDLSWHSLTMHRPSMRGGFMHRDEIPPGTLYLLILKTLARRGELH